MVLPILRVMSHDVANNFWIWHVTFLVECIGLRLVARQVDAALSII